jgi:hypothetical protein
VAYISQNILIPLFKFVWARIDAIVYALIAEYFNALAEEARNRHQ